MLAFLVASITFVAGLASMRLALRRLDGFGASCPDERSNHSRPTPQIGGIALVPVWLLAMAALPITGANIPVFAQPTFLLAITLLFVLGVLDDRHALGPLPKLTAQTVACALASYALVDSLADFALPAWLSYLLCTLVLLTIVNLTNFIDGLDLMAVATVGVPAAGFAIFATVGIVSAAYLPAGLATAALLLAFAIYNWHPARAFLGDGGSLPFGLVLGAMTIVVAGEAGPFFAALLPAYILFDGCVTLARRSLRGENVLQAHSSHLYQRAFRSGRGVLAVSMTAAGFGGAAIVLSLLAYWSGWAGASVAALAAAAAIWIAVERRLPLR